MTLAQNLASLGLSPEAVAAAVLHARGVAAKVLRAPALDARAVRRASRLIARQLGGARGRR